MTRCPHCGELGLYTVLKDGSRGYWHDTTWPGEPCKSHRWCWLWLTVWEGRGGVSRRGGEA